MKQFRFLLLVSVIIPLSGICQSHNTVDDDIYFSPTDAKVAKKQTTKSSTSPKYKNGAKEIEFVDRNHPATKTSDTILLAQSNDSVNYAQEDGKYINGFNGSESDYEYAERIRRFRNPRFTIHISDPAYNDIYFMNSSDWNGYVDDYNAYVTPTWTNPCWWNYRYGGYSSWGSGFYGSYGYSPWWGYNSYYGFGSYYGYSGFGGYYGYGDYYGYGGYYGYNHPYYGNGGSYYGHKHEDRRASSSNTSRTSGVGLGNSIGSGSSVRNQYTAISGGGSRIGGVGSRSLANTSSSREVSRQTFVSGSRENTTLNSNTQTARSINSRLSSGNGNYQTTTGLNSRATATNISTRPRTTSYTTASDYSTTNTGSRGSYMTSGSSNSGYTSGSNSRGSYSTSTAPSRQSYSNGSSSTSRSSGTSTSNSYNSGSTRSSSSYNSSSSSSSSSSGSSSSSSGSRSSGSSSGTRR